MNLSAIRQNLTRLEKMDELEKLLADADEGLPWNDFVWMLQFPAFVGAAIQITVMGMNARPEDDMPPGEDMAWMLLLVLLGLGFRFLHPLFRSRVQSLCRRLRRNGVVVPARHVQASPMWGQLDWVWGIVVHSHDPAVLQDPDKLSATAKDLFELKWQDRGAMPEAHAELAWMLYHEIAPVRSLPVPAELCHGLQDCWIATVMLPADPLRSGDLLLALTLPSQSEAVRRDPNAIAVLPDAVLD
ncbi:MAG: hypothetical protein ACE37K_19310 [Planctomycetota bacterium]